MSDLHHDSTNTSEGNEQDPLSSILSEASSSYVEAGKKYEDVKSTAWTFLLTGIAGIIFLLLLWSGILPLSLSVFTLGMMTIVLGILFLFFLIIGLKSFFEMQTLSEARIKEERSIIQIQQWFQEHYSADAISNGMDSEDISMDQLYFLRSENINRLMVEEFPSLEESFLEYMTEKIYQMYFPD